MSRPGSTLPSVPPTGRQLELSAGAYRAVIVQAGGGLRELERDGKQLIDGYGAWEPCQAGRGQLLAPWPNRVADGCYEFAGETRQLDLSEPGRRCAIHGLVRWSSWEVLEHEREHLRMRLRLHGHPGYPHVLDLVVLYRLDRAKGLEMRLSATNRGTTPAPYGLGMHPYLSAGTDRIDTCELTLAAESWLAVDERGIPRTERQPVEGSQLDFRRGRPIGETVLDTAFGDLGRSEDGLATIMLRDPASGRHTTLWADRSFAWIQIFSGDTLASRARRGLAVEPMTCPANALASGQDLIVLAPGEEHAARWGIAGA